MEYTDNELLAMIRGSEKEMNTALQILFGDGELSVAAVKQITQTFGAQLAEAQDAVQHAYGTFVVYVKKESFTLTGSLKGLFITISKKRWLAVKKSKSDNRSFNTDSIMESEQSKDYTDDLVLSLEKRQRIRRLLLTSVKPECQKMIWYQAYGTGFDGEELPPSFKEEKWFRQRLEKCRKKVLKFLKNDPALFNEFKNYATGG